MTIQHAVAPYVIVKWYPASNVPITDWAELLKRVGFVWVVA